MPAVLSHFKIFVKSFDFPYYSQQEHREGVASCQTQYYDYYFNETSNSYFSKCFKNKLNSFFIKFFLS